MPDYPRICGIPALCSQLIYAKGETQKLTPILIVDLPVGLRLLWSLLHPAKGDI